MKRIMILGATSAIATACARLWAADGGRFFLVGRDAEKLWQVAADLSARGASEAHVHVLDLTRVADHHTLFEHGFAALGAVDIALLAHGILSDQALCQSDVGAAVREFETNATSVIALLTELGVRLSAARAGTIAVISSVAGDRGRASNYPYGAAKAAVTAFSAGLRARLYPVGVHVLTIKPGPVATPMTAGMRLPGLLVATPEQVARDIVGAVRAGKGTLYTPWFWRPIMVIIRAMPEAILRRLPL
jgi:short-subunit dehydrogenase